MAKIKHKCNSCKYYYETKVNDTKTVYNALDDSYMNIGVKKDYPCCGNSPGGTALDMEQPRCSDFELEENPDI